MAISIRLGLFLILARLAHQGSRLSAVRWAEDHAVSEVLGLGSFDEDDLYAALDDLSARQEKIEQKLFQVYLRRKTVRPTNPQIRRLLGPKVLQLDLFSEQICEVEGDGVRYVLRKNHAGASSTEWRN